jgi:ribonuclease BN (tRNA processing enzyme)
MKIKILGTRGQIKPSAPYHSHHSGVLIDDTLLFDCGEKSFLQYHPKALFITHMHPDHAFFVLQAEDINVPIYAPEAYQNMNITIAKKAITIDGYTVHPIPTVHSMKVKSTAYLIEHNDKRILYTGDIITIEKEYRTLLKPCDAIITEASHIKQGGLIRQILPGKPFGHTGIPNLVRFFKPYANKIIFVHFGSWFYEDMHAAREQFKELAREYDIEIIVGYDGMEIEV